MGEGDAFSTPPHTCAIQTFERKRCNIFKDLEAEAEEEVARRRRGEAEKPEKASAPPVEQGAGSTGER